MNFRKYFYHCVFLLLLSVWDTLGFDYDLVTCGSAVKLMNKDYKVRLHSHDVKYGSGSGQQSVTGMQDKADANSYWQVRGGVKKECFRGTPIKCGQTVRLTHVNTQKNLHSHHFASPMSSEQEVSAFGDSGEGDHLDEWVIVCDGKHWSRKDFVRIKHKETDAYLSCGSNTYGRPINGQQEVLATFTPNRSSNFWKAVEGVYIKPSEGVGKE